MKLLILEESGVSRRFIKAELVPAGYEILEARSPAEAMTILTSVPDIDLITLRVVMKGTDGFEFLAQLYTDEVCSRLRLVGNDKIPAVFVTSSDTDKDRLRGFQVGAADFVQKPWKPGELLRRVNQILGRGTELEGMSVLVVDDSSTARKFIRSSLGRLGIQIHEADDGDTAVEILRDERNSVDLVITDLTMRRMNGDSLILKIRGELGLTELPVIFLSGNPDKSRILSLFKMGATDYIEKPFLQEELVSRIRAYLSREKTQKQLLSSNARLRDMDLVKDQFIAACSHDFRSPLVGILGYAQLLEGEKTLSDKHLEMVEGIRNSGDYLLSLITDLLDIGKMASGRSEIRKDEVSLFDVLSDSVKSLIHTAGPKGVSLDVCSSVDSSMVLGDRSALLRIANNILSNAIKFTPGGGRVKASVEEGRRADEFVLVVSDSGIGIKEEDIPELFKRYTRASQSGTSGEPGTGLGLSITKSLVEAHGGTLAVESVVGQGTSFRVYLPAFVSGSLLPKRIEECSIPRREPEPAITSDSTNGLFVLLVDDVAVNRAVGQAILKKMGFTVELAEDGSEALEKYKQSCDGRRFDLVLMDIELPILNGLEATEEIRAYESNLPDGHEVHEAPVAIWAMTANSDAHLGECTSAGMTDFLTKPFVMSQIRDAVDRWNLLAKLAA